MYGVSGLGQNLTPPQFAYNAITDNLQLAPDVRISNPAPIRPLPGYTAAAIMDIAFTKMGLQGPQRTVGLVISKVVSVYARSDAVVTLMLALDNRWGAVQSWLPEVALQTLNTGPNPDTGTGLASTHPALPGAALRCSLAQSEPDRDCRHRRGCHGDRGRIGRTAAVVVAAYGRGLTGADRG